jgi:hypothetical protein
MKSIVTGVRAEENKGSFLRLSNVWCLVNEDIDTPCLPQTKYLATSK